MIPPNVAEALDDLIEEAEDARLILLKYTLVDNRREVESGSCSAEVAAHVFETRAASLDVLEHPVAAELTGMASTARDIYLRAAGAMRARFCVFCKGPAQGRYSAKLGAIGPKDPACNSCGERLAYGAEVA